jgi:hypothetical protein
MAWLATVGYPVQQRRGLQQLRRGPDDVRADGRQRGGLHPSTWSERRLRDGKAISLWAAYFEPQAVLEKLGIKLAVDGGMNA